MIKTIKLQTGFHTISTEEMLSTFEEMIYKFAHNCTRNLQTIEGNLNEFDDYVQLGRMEAMSAFKTYDANTGILFSTYLSNALRYIYVHLVRDMNAQKRKTEKPLLYINKELESGEDGSNVIADQRENTYFLNGADNELEVFLLENLTEEDVVFLTMGLKKQVSKSKGCQKASLTYTLDVLSDKTKSAMGLTKSELAERLGLSRPTLNKRINSAMKKTQELAMQSLNGK